MNALALLGLLTIVVGARRDHEPADDAARRADRAADARGAGRRLRPADRRRSSLAGIQETAPVAAMFVFAILFFGVMTDAGLLDPIVDGILRVVGLHPTRIVVGSALLALLVHLDGSAR